MQKTDNPTLREIAQLLLTGHDLPLPAWQSRLQDPAFARIAQQLIWQSGGRRFTLSPGGRCHAMDGSLCSPADAVSLAHPVELDAAEILHWRRWLRSEGITQPLLQMMEPVVLQGGRLPGGYQSVLSANAAYEMCDRYRGYQLPLSAIPSLEAMDCRFAVRHHWNGSSMWNSDIELVNVITPAGVLYGCRPSQPIKKLSADANGSLALNLLYPYPGVRLRTLNHVAAFLDARLLSQFLQRDALELLLPHLPGMEPEALRQLLQRSAGSPRCRAMLERVFARKEASPC